MEIAKLVAQVTEQMVKQGIALTDLGIVADYNKRRGSVTFNNSIEVTMHNRGLIVKDLDTEIEYGYHSIESKDLDSKSVITRTIEWLLAKEWYPGDDIEHYGEWYKLTQRLEEPKNFYLLDEDFNLSEPTTREALEDNGYTNVTLECRLK